MIPRWNPEQVDEVAAGGGALLVDLRSEWCTQCGPQERVLERIAPEFAERVRFVSVDVGEHPAFADRHDVGGLPAFLLYAGGERRQVIRGFKRVPELRLALRELIGNGD